VQALTAARPSARDGRHLYRSRINLVAQWNAAGAIGAVKEEPAPIDAAVATYLDDARARHLDEGHDHKF
jgi:hypothetical protein